MLDLTFGFTGLELGKRALQAQNRSMEVIGHNIANANTEGFSRQRAEQVTTYPYTKPGINMPSGPGQIGSGVKVASIQRLRNEFVDARIRNESKSFGYGEKLKEGLYELELIFNEPTQYGVRESLDSFWESIQELINNPESLVVRNNMEQRGLALTQSINYVGNQLLEFRKDLDTQIGYTVTEINSLSQKIADLNYQITQVEGTGWKANDLADSRDLLLTKLSKLADVRLLKDERGQISVSLGGRRLVQGDYYQLIDTAPTGEGGRLELTWSDTGAPVLVTSGELRGIMDIRDETVPYYKDGLDTLARDLVYYFNEQHRQGIDLHGEAGEDFFVFLDGREDEAARHIMVSPLISEDPKRIAAAHDPDSIPGGNKNAIELANVFTTRLMDDGGSTFNEFYTSFISTLGVQSHAAENLAENQEHLLHQLENWQESISGVALDEEMANLIRYQHAFNAAARLINVTDQLLETLIGLIR